eukprot:sb/3471661/
MFAVQKKLGFGKQRQGTAISCSTMVSKDIEMAKKGNPGGESENNAAGEAKKQDNEALADIHNSSEVRDCDNPGTQPTAESYDKLEAENDCVAIESENASNCGAIEAENANDCGAIEVENTNDCGAIEAENANDYGALESENVNFEADQVADDQKCENDTTDATSDQNNDNDIETECVQLN